jgi:hypothetical protein
MLSVYFNKINEHDVSGSLFQKLTEEPADRTTVIMLFGVEEGRQRGGSC